MLYWLPCFDQPISSTGPSVSPFRDFSSSFTTGGWVLLICGWFLLVIGGSVIGARARLWPAPISRDSPPCPCHICEPPPRITKYIWFGIIPLLVKLAGPITFEIFWNGHRQFLYNARIYFFMIYKIQCLLRHDVSLWWKYLICGKSRCGAEHSKDSLVPSKERDVSFLRNF